MKDEIFIQELRRDWIGAGMSEQDADAMEELVTENWDWLNDEDVQSLRDTRPAIGLGH